MTTTTNTLTLAEIAALLQAHNVSPDADFAAASGQDYGYVRAWDLPDGRALIAYGNNADTDYELADSSEDLEEWLLSDDLDDDARILHRANVLGAEAIEEAPEESDRELMVLISRYYYGPSERCHLAEDERSETIRFASYAEAQEWIEEAESGPYICSHNESGAPSYKIVEL